MSVTFNSNVLLYASDGSSPPYESARTLLAGPAAGPELVYLFWLVVMAYLRISTHPSIFDRPLDPANARSNIDQLIRRPQVQCPGEHDDFWRVYQELVRGDPIRGNLVTDSHIAALMRQHGIAKIYTADRDFRRFPGITPIDPYTDDTQPNT